MYYNKDLATMLEEEFFVDPSLVHNAVDSFVQDLRNNKYEHSIILVDGDEDVSIEGDLEEDAEHVYSTQRYWNLPEAPVDAVGLEDVELPLAPWEEKLLREDGEL